MSDTIPGPKGMPFIGNLLDIRNGEYSIDAMRHMANQYGPIYQLTIMGNKRLIVSSYKLLNELCDEKRFSKVPPGPLGEAKDGKAVGLFSARNEDPNWGLAHRVLLPAFGPLAIENMFDGEFPPDIVDLSYRV
jgi:cytochrome P450/NADPH-cytochrome P450 reductase